MIVTHLPFNVQQLFWLNVIVRDGCWAWLCKAHSKEGYARIDTTVNGVRYRILAHRASWIIHNNSVPKFLILHKCDNPICTNPSHLFEGTDLDNSNDKCLKNRQTRGEEVFSSKLSELQIFQVRADYATGKFTQRELGKKYGLNHCNICSILNRKTWSHV